MKIIELSKSFPKEEKHALTSQTRRSLSSVCLNLRESKAKGSCNTHSISKIMDCDGENLETDSSLVFSLDRNYISFENHNEPTLLSKKLGVNWKSSSIIRKRF